MLQFSKILRENKTDISSHTRSYMTPENISFYEIRIRAYKKEMGEVIRQKHSLRTVHRKWVRVRNLRNINILQISIVQIFIL